MFELIDLIVAPLTDVNPLRYWRDAAYRRAKAHELGARLNRILLYQASMFSLAAILGLTGWVMLI